MRRFRLHGRDDHALQLKDANILSELHPGDVITADILVSQDADADVLLDHIVVSRREGRITGPRLSIMCRRRAMRCLISD